MLKGAVLMLLVAGVFVFAYLVLYPEIETRAALVPDPATQAWLAGDKATLWLDTDHARVTLSTGTRLAVSGITLPATETAEDVAAVKAGGCMAAIVSGVSAELLDADADDLPDAATVTVSLHKASDATATIYSRWYKVGGSLTTLLDTSGITAATFAHNITIGSANWEQGVTYRYDASLEEDFPAAYSYSVAWTVPEADTEGVVAAATITEIPAGVLLAAGTTVEVTACEEGSDAYLELRGADNAVLARYPFAIGTAPAAAPPAPAFTSRYKALRFCPDAVAPRSALLDGGETVGSVNVGGAVAYELLEDEHGLDNAFFAVASTGAVTTSLAGADDYAGIDGERLYSFVVQATNVGGLTSDQYVVVQLDKGYLADAGDGVCNSSAVPARLTYYSYGVSSSLTSNPAALLADSFTNFPYTVTVNFSTTATEGYIYIKLGEGAVITSMNDGSEQVPFAIVNGQVWRCCAAAYDAGVHPITLRIEAEEV